MKILLLHTDYIEYEITEKAIKDAEKVKTKKDRLDEALAVFMAVERSDAKDIDGVVEKTVEEIQRVAKMVQVKDIMLYPYAHLSSNLAEAKIAQLAIENVKVRLKKTFSVKKSPFGWYKAFRLSCKGHPLAELSREITSDKIETKKEKEVISSWYILTVDGGLIEAEKYDFSGHEELKKFYEYEAFGSRKAEKQPTHIALMKNLEIADYEPGSDVGNLRWYPKGRLIKKLLERQVEEMCLSMGAMEVETPLIYDTTHPALKTYIEKFPARQYRLEGDKGREFFLRFAACFGQYLIAKDMLISYKNLPLRFFELAKSFRKEQHGELSGLKRLRSFTMPDMHTLCATKKQAIEEFKKQFVLSLEWIRLLNLEGEIGLRFVKRFFKENKVFAENIAREAGKPILIELWDEQYFYFITKFEFNMNDSVGKSFALSTVQIDVENTQSFDITYIDEKGKARYPLLLHTSISGGIDRCICAILEKEGKKIKKGEKGMFPLWLSPTHIRLLPISPEYLPDCLELAKKVKGRVDIDDRDASISKKIRDAEKEWIPIIIVYGENERESYIFKPRYRFPCEKANITLEELNNLIEGEIRTFPFEHLPLPQLLSKRPRFR